MRHEIGRSTLRSAILLGVAAVVCTVAKTELGWFPGAVTLLGLTAFGLDLADEWRARRAHADLVPVGSVHDVDAADVAASTPAAHGIPVHLRGGWTRAMLRILGPFVPVELLVPAARRDDAARALRALLGEELLGGEGGGGERGEPAKRPRKRRRAAAS